MINKINNPKFSIITLSYNHEKFIDQTIKSVLNQTFQNFEYIIVDGKSTDSSRKIIEKYSKHPKIKIIYQEKNEGPVSSLNLAFKEAKGEILGYINSDDFYLKNTLKKVSNVFKSNPSLNLIFGNAHVIDDQNYKIKDFISKKFSHQRFRLNQQLICQQATFFKKNIYDKTSGFNPVNKRSWDFELFVDMVKKGATYKKIDYYLACFRVYSDSITSNGTLENRKENLKHLHDKFFFTTLSKKERIQKFFIFMTDRINLLFFYYKLKILYYKIFKIKIDINE